MHDELALLQRWAAGDGDSGQRLTQRHYSSIYYFFCTKVDADQVEDLVNSTFLALYEGARAHRVTSNVRAYLFGTARLKLFDYFRRRSNFADRFEPLEHSVADMNCDVSISTMLDTRDELAQFYGSLRSLPVDTQLLVELKCYYEFTETELGEMFGIQKTAVRARVVRARRTLRRLSAEQTASEPSLASQSPAKKTSVKQTAAPDEPLSSDEVRGYFTELRSRCF